MSAVLTVAGIVIRDPVRRDAAWKRGCVEAWKRSEKTAGGACPASAAFSVGSVSSVARIVTRDPWPVARSVASRFTRTASRSRVRGVRRQRLTASRRTGIGVFTTKVGARLTQGRSDAGVGAGRGGGILSGLRIPLACVGDARVAPTRGVCLLAASTLAAGEPPATDEARVTSDGRRPRGQRSHKWRLRMQKSRRECRYRPSWRSTEAVPTLTMERL